MIEGGRSTAAIVTLIRPSVVAASRASPVLGPRAEWVVGGIQGNAEILIGKLQERYGYSREQAERELEHWDVERERRSA
jgi:hypothetical protein